MKSFMIKVLSPLVVVLVALTIFGFVPQLGANEVYAEDQKPALIVQDPWGKEDLCYDGTQQTLVVPGEALGGTMKYAVTGLMDPAPTSGYSTELPTAMNPGNYCIWFYAEGDGSYKDSRESYTYARISTRTVTFNVDSLSKIKGEADPVFTGTVTGLLEGDSLGDVTFERTDKSEEPGTYSVVPVFTEHPFYNYDIKGGSFTIYESAPVPPEPTDPPVIMDFCGSVSWVDGNNAEGYRPDYHADQGVKLTLHRESAAYGEEIVAATPDWDYTKFTFHDLDIYDDAKNEWNYWVTAEQPEGYMPPKYDDAGVADRLYNGGVIQFFLLSSRPFSFTGTKIWVDGGKMHDNAKEVRLELWRKSAKGGESPKRLTSYPYFLTPSWKGNSFSFDNLPGRDGEGYAYNYYVVEHYMPGFEDYFGYSLPEYANEDPAVTDRVKNGGTITSKLIADKTEIGGSIAWDDNGQSHDNSKEVSLILKRISDNPVSTGEETVDASPVWNGDSYTFGNLDVYDKDGYGYNYWMVAEQVEGYEAPIYSNIDTGVTDKALDRGTITNKKQKHDGITFIEWTDALAAEQNGSEYTASDSLPKQEGSYYLTKNVNLGSRSWEVPSGTTNLLLNGQSITSTEDDEGAVVIDYKCTLNLYDEPAGDAVGTITNKEGNGVCLKDNRAEFNMYGGEISGCGGDGVFIDESESAFNMYGGKISNCDIGVDIFDSEASFTLHTGTITGNNVGVDYGTGTFIIAGKNASPQITGNTKNLVMKGNDIDPMIIRIASGTTFRESASIGVSLIQPPEGIFTDGLDGTLPQGKTAADIFTSDDPYYYVDTSGGEARLVEGERVATPTFSLAEGTYHAAQNVAISCATEGAAIYYTTDGTDPTASGTKYTDPISIASTTTIKAIAVKTDMANSAIGTAAYEIDVDPHGCIDAVTGKVGSIDVAGWAFDPSDTSEPVEIHVYIGGEAGVNGAEGHGQIIANKARTDVDDVYHCGDHHGFSETITTSKRGEQKVYVYAINNGEGKNICLGNKTVTITCDHVWDAGVVTKEPTTKEFGEKTLTCEVCHATRTESIPRLDIDPITPSDETADDTPVDNKIPKVNAGKIRTIGYFAKNQMKVIFPGKASIDNYRIQYRLAGKTKWTSKWTGGKSSYIIKNLKKKSLCQFRIAGYVKQKDGSWKRGKWSKISYRYMKSVTLKAVTPGKKKLTVKWTKDRNCNGYMIQYALKSSMDGAKSITISKKSKTQYTIKNLKKGKKYYVKIRPLKKKSGKTYLGILTKAKSAKVK